MADLSERRKGFPHRTGDNPFDTISAHVLRYKGAYALVAYLLLPVLTNAANRVIGSSAPITVLNAQARRQGDSLRLAANTADRVGFDLKLHAQQDSVEDAEQARVNALLLMSQCFDRTSGELAIMRRLAALDCSDLGRRGP